MISRSLLRIKILQVLYAHFNTGGGTDIGKPEKDLTYSIQKSYDLYFHFLMLPIAVKRYAESRIEIARNKKLPTFEDLNPNMRFVEDKVILQIEDDPNFRKYVSERAINWADHPELIKNLYNRMIESLYYKEYMEREKSGYTNDKQLLVSFFSSEFEDFEMLLNILEEQCIFWNDDIELIVGMTVKTIKNTTTKKFDILPLFKSDEDREFAFSLLKATITNYAEYHKIVDGFVENWDIERVAHIDNLIIQLAINELVEFPTIPVKVTFDEYLEMAKFYSTPKSSIFINGLLDKIAEDLTQKGKIVKYGADDDEVVTN